MAYKTIKLKKYSDIIEEITATAAAITPGMLVEQFYSGTSFRVRAHSNAAQNALPMFALEDELQGKGINDNYPVSAKIQVWIPNRGDQVYAILADGESVVIGDFLESNGAGLLQKHVEDIDSSAMENTIYSNVIVAQALETINISTSSGLESSGDLGYDKRIRVRII